MLAIKKCKHSKWAMGGKAIFHFNFTLTKKKKKQIMSENLN